MRINKRKQLNNFLKPAGGPAAFSLWAIERLAERKMCKVERSLTCIPLKGDPICGACYEGDDAAVGARLGAPIGMMKGGASPAPTPPLNPKEQGKA